MGSNRKSEDKSRRRFLSLFLSGNQKASTDKIEKVKMLTAEGKLVEIDKAVLDEVAKKQKSTNKEIYQWMKNPSKEKG